MVVVELFNSDGTRLTSAAVVERTGERLNGNVYTLTLPVHSTLSFTLLGDSTTKVGWLKYRYVSSYTNPAFGGFAAIHGIFRQKLPGLPNLEAVVLPDWGLDDEIIAPFDNKNGFVTSMALANGSSYSNNKVKFEIYDETGTLISTYEKIFPVGRHMAFETYREWPETANQRGTIKVISSGYGMATVSLLFNPTGSLTSSQFYEFQPLN